MAENKSRVLLDPLFNNNPIALQVLGICSALAVTTKMETTVVMCGAVIFVLVGSGARRGGQTGAADTRDRGPLPLLKPAADVDVVSLRQILYPA